MPLQYLDREAPLLSRKDWASEVGFHTLPDHLVLERVLEEIATVRMSRKEAKPVVIFDLDSTLYEVTPRTFHIFNTWYVENRAQLPKPLEEAFATLTLEEVGYSVADTFRNLGLDPETEVNASWRAKLKEYWFERFFSDNFLTHDRPYAGASEYVRSVRDAGARLVYLTGRERSKMQGGTIRNLRRDGFPLLDDTLLLMRENEFFDDVEHKISAVTRFAGRDNVVASFENEPRNLVALMRALPRSMHIYVDTVCSHHPAELVESVYRIKGFGAPRT